MHPSRKEFWYFVIAIVALPAFLINLGMMPLNDDEAIRTLVAMEMDFSGNFIVPTLNGEEYRAKPPLYNYFLYASFSIAGVNEWSARIPNILFLAIFGYIIFYYSKKHFSTEYSIINALMFLTCGRILFWDSMLAYIDISYSMFTFWSFMVIYHAFQKKKWIRLFIFSYLLTAVGFLMKGFPSLLFQALTLLALFISQKEWKRLFSVAHVAGLMLWIGIVGTYYILYNSQANMEETLNGLLDQSTRRTAIHEQYDYVQFILHLFTYPFENLYHFLPWTFMVVYLFGRKSLLLIKENSFLRYCGIVFIINIIVYWVSVEVYPRYILMLVPLVFSIFLYLHKKHYDEHSKLYVVYIRLTQVVFAAMLLASFIVLKETMDVDIPYRYIKMGVGLVVLVGIFICYTRFKSIRLLSFIAAVLVMRIIFNFFFIPERYQGNPGEVCKQQAIHLGLTQKENALSIYKNSNIDLTSSVYISRERDRITRRSQEIEQSPGLSILDTSRVDIPHGVVVKGEICVREGQQVLFLVQKE